MNEREFGWEDIIEKDSEFELVPEGNYNFEVIKFERGRHGGSEKLPPCNKAILTIKVTSPTASTTLTHNLFLHSRTEGMLCAFFTAIGQRKKGESIAMDWGAVVGSRGRCKVGVRKWKNDEGEERASNSISRFYEPDTETPPAGTRFEVGKF